MDKNRKTSIIYFLAAAACYVCSVIWFCIGKGGLGAMWLCIGAANMCLGRVWLNRYREAEKQNQPEEKNPEDE